MLQMTGVAAGDTLTFSAVGGAVPPVTLTAGQTSATAMFTSSALAGRAVTASIVTGTTTTATSNTVTFVDDVALTVFDLTHDAAGNLVAVVHAGDTPVDASSCKFVSQYNSGPLVRFDGTFTATPGDPLTGNCTGTIPGGLPPGDWQLTATVKEQDGDQAFRGDRFTVAGPPNTTPPPTTPVPPLGALPARVDANSLLLQCAKSSVAITDISKRSGGVRILGLTAPASAGQDVDIAFSKSTNVVATATVAADGTFRATAPLPANGVANSNSARYRATLGTSSTPWLKLTRRLALTGMHVVNGALAIGGRLSKPLIRGAAVVVRTQSSCNGAPAVIAHLPVDSSGAFSREVPLPATVTGVVVSLIATVRSPSGSRFITNSIARPIQVR